MLAPPQSYHFPFVLHLNQVSNSSVDLLVAGKYYTCMCRQALCNVGLFCTGQEDCPDDQEEVTGILQKAHLARKGAEHSAKQLLHRLERIPPPGCATSPWEDLSSNSHTTRWVNKQG